MLKYGVPENSAPADFLSLCADEPELETLRAKIRDFLAADRTEFGWRPTVDAWLSSWDEDFSARLGRAGFLGLTIPVEYGGRGLSHLHRYVVIEELLASGAPVAAHWIADRQVAPGLLSYGSDSQKSELLPRIAAGQLFSSIGMSEPDAGSDLAAATTRAIATEGGWLLSGTKVWTSGAHLAHQIVVLARTSAADPGDRHAGFSQFIVPTETPGIRVGPILMMSGEHHFNEVQFEHVFVPKSALLGRLGHGWHQVTAELSFERSGPERILTTMPLLGRLIELLADHAGTDYGCAVPLGKLLARLISLRQMSISVARALTDGQSPTSEAALVKDLGTRFEQESVELAAELLSFVGMDPALHTRRMEVERLLAVAQLHSPLFTLRGGTNEVLRGVVAREMGLR